MTGRHWLRKDVLLPIFYLIIIGAVFAYLINLAKDVPEINSIGLFHTGTIVLAILYGLLCVVTIRHALSTYDLERYDPGSPESLRRLMKRRRFKLPNRPFAEGRLMVRVEQFLIDHDFKLETERHEIGRVYSRRHTLSLPGRQTYDRIFLLQHEPLNVLMVDQLLRDTLRYIRKRDDKPSHRNMLLLTTRMVEDQDVLSAAAGVVNFLGDFESGSLCPLLLATRQARLFYPADRSLMPRLHRLWQDQQISSIRQLIAGLQEEVNNKASRQASQ